MTIFWFKRRRLRTPGCVVEIKNENRAADDLFLLETEVERKAAKDPFLE